MKEADFQDWLQEVIEEHDGGEEAIGIRTFEEAGVLTKNKGLVVRMGGDEFQITIVRSDGADTFGVTTR